jgi:hypothetical protein
MMGLGGLFAGVLGTNGVVGVGDVFLRLLLGRAVRLVVDFDAGRRLRCIGRNGFLNRSNDRIWLRDRRKLVRRMRRQWLVVGMAVIVMVVLAIMIMVMVVSVIMRLMLMVLTMDLVRMRLEGVMIAMGLLPLEGLRLEQCGIGAGALDDLAADAVAIAAAARAAVARAAAMRAVFALFLGLAVSALIGLDQRLPVGDRDLVVVGMNFAEGEEAVPVAAIFNEGGLQRRLYSGDLGEIDVAAQLLALGGLEIKLFDSIAANHNDPGLLRVGGVDQHFVGHLGTHDGGGRVSWRAQTAQASDATVHLIRG